THYINEVRIMVNSATVVNMQYTSQPTNNTFTYTYPIQASAGSTISLRAECNLEGERTQTLLVGGATQTATPTMTTTTATPTATQTGTTTTVATTQTTTATTQPTTVPTTTAQAPGFGLWIGILAIAGGCFLFLRR
ncbi:MAG: hypothetical protein LUQ40_05275, partial [Methanomicrobiales archaeon]|nr:hypothetical protein [Methanomicrobiales archaeon]